jgi:hypothetical protein
MSYLTINRAHTGQTSPMGVCVPVRAWAGVTLEPRFWGRGTGTPEGAGIE